MTAQSTPDVSGLSRGNPDDELAALVVLIGLKRMPMDQVAARVEGSGSATAVLDRIAEETVLAPAFSADDIAAARALVQSWRQRRLDVRGVFDARYPRNLLAIFNKPPMVFVRGTWDELRDGVAVAVVGTRKPTPDGMKRAQLASRKLARAGITVLSGLAAGIDTAAHTAALDAGGRTAAVLGTGIDVIYPAENRDLAARIVESGGALLSQFFPDQPPTRWSFPARNVVMSGLSVATLVIEAGETSGAKNQARNALEHGRAVFLPKSLVASHAWAQRMVTTGVSGVRALQIDSPDEIVDRLTFDDMVLAM